MTENLVDSRLLQKAQKRVLKNCSGFDAVEQKLLSMWDTEPERKAFLDICRQLELACILDRDRTEQEVLPKVTEAVQGWPSELRMAPVYWTNLLIHFVLPVEALRMVSSLSLTSAMVDHCYDNFDYEQLLRWFRQLPEDCPTVEGLSLSHRQYDLKYSWQKVKLYKDLFLPEKTFESRAETYYYETDGLRLMLSSPLCRELVYLDASFSDSYYGPHQSTYEALDGRELGINTVLNSISSDRLQTLNLVGCITSLDSFSITGTHPTIQNLALGGIFPPTDKALKAIAKAFPNLRQLEFKNGVVNSVYNESFDFDDEDYDAEQWQYHSKEDLKKRLVTKSGLNALVQLEHFELFVGGGYQADEDNLFSDTIESAMDKLGSKLNTNTYGEVASWRDHYRVP